MSPRTATNAARLLVGLAALALLGPTAVTAQTDAELLAEEVQSILDDLSPPYIDLRPMHLRDPEPPPWLSRAGVFGIAPGADLDALLAHALYPFEKEYEFEETPAGLALHIRSSWRQSALEGGAGLFHMNGSTVHSAEFWLSLPDAVAWRHDIPPILLSLLPEEESGVLPPTETRGHCSITRAAETLIPGSPPLLAVRSEGAPPLGTGLRSGEFWVALGPAELPAWAPTCDTPYSAFGYTLGMPRGAIDAIWLPIDGSRRFVRERRGRIEVSTKLRGARGLLLDAALTLDGGGRIARIEVDRFTRYENYSQLTCHLLQSFDDKRSPFPSSSCWRERYARLEAAECPDYLDGFAKRFGEPLARFGHRRERERAIWIDAEAGVAIAAEQTERDLCTAVSFTMRRASSLDESMDASALYALIRNDEGARP